MAYRTSSPGACVVCGAPVETAHWPNAWERSLAVRACCRAECVGAFDLSRHWIPSAAPALLDDAAASAAVANGRDRMRAGDDAGPVARDLLVAGVPSWMVRNAVVAVGAGARRRTREVGALSWLTLGGWFASPHVRHDATTGIDGLDAVTAWEARFGGASK